MVKMLTILLTALAAAAAIALAASILVSNSANAAEIDELNKQQVEMLLLNEEN